MEHYNALALSDWGVSLHGCVVNIRRWKDRNRQFFFCLEILTLIWDTLMCSNSVKISWFWKIVLTCLSLHKWTLWLIYFMWSLLHLPVSSGNALTLAFTLMSTLLLLSKTFRTAAASFFQLHVWFLIQWYTWGVWWVVRVVFTVNFRSLIDWGFLCVLEVLRIRLTLTG
jgi:hypothetical protein